MVHLDIAVQTLVCLSNQGLAKGIWGPRSVCYELLVQ